MKKPALRWLRRAWSSMGYTLRRWKPEWIMAAATVGLLIVTGVNVGVARSQWRAMERQTKAMETANRLTKEAQADARAAEDRARTAAVDADRPWVSVSVIGVPAMLPTGKPQVRLMLLNTGKNPAAHVVVVYSFTMSTSGHTPTSAFSGPREGPLVILPAAPVEKTIEMARELSPEQIAAVRARTLSLFVRAEIAYKDRIDRDHRTTFCVFFNGGDPNACSTGNSAD